MSSTLPWRKPGPRTGSTMEGKIPLSSIPALSVWSRLLNNFFNYVELCACVSVVTVGTCKCVCSLLCSKRSSIACLILHL